MSLLILEKPLISSLKLQYEAWLHRRYRTARKRERLVLKRQARRHAKRTARMLRASDTPVHGQAYVKKLFGQKYLSYWHISVGANPYDNSEQFTRLFENGTVLLREIPHGPMRLRRTQLRTLIRNLKRES